MARIAGINLPEKRLEVALTYIYGIGRPTALKILNSAQINPDLRPSKLSEQELERVREIIEKNYKVEGEKRAEVATNIKRLKLIGSYRGLRHTKNLPVRGQRTRTNARTLRGKRVTVGSGRKKASEKT